MRQNYNGKLSSQILNPAILITLQHMNVNVRFVNALIIPHHMPVDARKCSLLPPYGLHGSSMEYFRPSIKQLPLRVDEENSLPGNCTRNFCLDANSTISLWNDVILSFHVLFFVPISVLKLGPKSISENFRKCFRPNKTSVIGQRPEVKLIMFIYLIKEG